MPHAFLFDNNESYSNFFESVKKLLTSSIIKSEDGAYVIRLGDLLFLDKASTIDELLTLAIKSFGAANEFEIELEAATDCLQNRPIFCIVVEGMDNSEALLMHDYLEGYANYLGYHLVDYSIPIHMKYYRAYLSRKFRIYNDKLEVFYKMGDQETIDPMWVEELGKYFKSATNEDDGVHDTIFDSFDTLDHFKRVEFCRRGLTKLFNSKQANSLLLVIEDINPKLSDNIYSAIKALENYETAEDSAQASLSMRRFIESLADTLFPARASAKGERNLNQSAYRNRIWQYIANAYSHDQDMALNLGRELDRVNEVANKGLHGEISKEETKLLINDILSLTKAVTSVSLSELRKSEYPFRRSINEFVQRLIEYHNFQDN